jgi:peptidoglycan hydrolase-like protein with peptidoglycan-binding domain/GH24 family phage-related lysozyme (muramidase)
VPSPGVELIKTFEGSRLEAYPDPKTGGLPITIGWGSTRKKDGSPFQLGERISQQEAEDLLMWQLEREFLPPLRRIPGWQNLSEQQQGAILSFAYNLGANFFNARGFETISRVLREQDWKAIERALVLYRNPGTNVEEGLLRRRLSEAQVFLDGTPGVSLSDAARKYLSGGHTPSGGNLSREAQEYLRGSGGATGRRTLRLTSPLMQGKDVQEVQRALTRKGYPLVADGWFGPATARAVMAFQRQNGLVVDGIVGPKTWDLLLDRILFLSTPFLVGDDVRAVQRALLRSGYPVAVDGIFGPGTERAVRQFQASRGLVADGVVGPQTRAKLGV